ncbi:MAG: Adenosine deaminase, partial [Phycisphaerales bacterium]|nr:Adenosine deaminase [Phycisphaerales bacterium]
PGLVNAHVHLELSDLSAADLAPDGPPASLADWLLKVIGAGPPPSQEGEARAAAATRAGIDQCLRFGVTTVGDVTRFPGVTRRALADSPLRAVSFGEVTAMAGRRHLLDDRVAAAMATSPAPARVVAALGPHAPYSVEPTGYRRCVAAARAARLPVMTHLAESADETAFLADHAGPFRKLWDAIGGWDDAVPRIEGGPVRLAALTGLLDYERALLVHANHLEDVDVRRLARGAAAVAFCPRTHAYFGHPPHPWRRLLGAGVTVAVGTDSAASSPDLNLLDDLRLLRRQNPDLPAEELWRLATVGAASALSLAETVGSLWPGKAADFVAFPVDGEEDPFAEVLDDREATPTGVWIAGERVR